MPGPAERRYDLVLVGSGFASTFFLDAYLRRAPADARVLVLERGPHRDHAAQLADPEAWTRDAERSFVNVTPAKPWAFTLALGGGSNCWWACTPRMLPADFEVRRRHGAAVDWPLAYDDLEDAYCEVEERMQVAGDSGRTPFPRSRPYPQPPHRFGAADELLAAAFPGSHFHQPAARPTRPTARRAACCGSGVCGLCPVDAKFTVLNEMAPVLADPRVTVALGARAERVETAAGLARGVHYRTDEGRDAFATADVVALGANAIMNAHLLLASGIQGGPVGEGLVEQASVTARVVLDRFLPLGSTSVTGHGYRFADEPGRSGEAAALVEVWSTPVFDARAGAHRQALLVKLVLEDERQAGNRVLLDAADPALPRTSFAAGRSPRTERALARIGERIDAIVAPLPVVRVDRFDPAGTESHVLGTTVMGTDPATSVVDPDLVHHHVRNLLVLGGGAFPTAAPANPTLTLSALSWRAAGRLLGGAVA